MSAVWKRRKSVSLGELIAYFVAILACFGFIAPALISAKDTILVLLGFLVLILVLVWAGSIVRRVWQYEDLSNDEG